MIRKVTVEVIAVLFILLFFYTAVSKFIDFERFKLGIEQSSLLKPYANWIRWIIPSSEILVSVLLAIPRFRLKGLYASFVLMLLFTIYVAGVLKFSTRLPCSCGGVLQQMNWPTHLIFNIVFTLLAALAIYMHKGLGIMQKSKVIVA